MERTIGLLLLLTLSCDDTGGGGGGPGPGKGCHAGAECSDDAMPICDPIARSCRPCMGAMDDAACRERSMMTARCGPGGRCAPAACTRAGQSDECRDPQRPICAMGACQPCTRAAECGSRACRADGSCYDANQVVHVDNKNGTCDGTRAHKGTPEDPHCDLKAGIDAAVKDGKAAVHLLGTQVPYSPAVVSATPKGGLLLVGTGSADGVEPASILGDGPALAVYGGTELVDLRVQDLDLGSKLADAVLCDKRTGTSMPKLGLSGCTVHDAYKAGISATTCDLTLDRVRIYGARLGGLSLSGSRHAINNVMVYNNQGGGIALKAPEASSVLRFATIYGNTTVGQAGSGVNCDSQANVLIEDSIVFGNLGKGSQFAGCKLQSVVTGTEMLPGAIAKGPEFVSDSPPFDLHLKGSAANYACCIDRVPPAAGLTTHDIDGTGRPQGAAWDIGAHEVVQ